MIEAGHAIRQIRQDLAPATLAELYEPNAMNLQLIRAHESLDRLVDAFFDPAKRKWTDADRFSVLIEHYIAMKSANELPIKGPTAAAGRKRRSRPSQA